MPKPSKGRMAAKPKAKPKRRQPEAGLFGGLPPDLRMGAVRARQAAASPADSVRRWRFILDAIGADQLRHYAEDSALPTADEADEATGGRRQEAVAKLVLNLAEQIRRMAATEFELQPREYDAMEVRARLTASGKDEDSVAGLWQGDRDTKVIE